MVEDVMDPRNKRKASTDGRSSNKKRRGDEVIYISSSSRDELEVVSVKGGKRKAEADQESSKKRFRRSSVINITSSVLVEGFNAGQSEGKACRRRSSESPSSSVDEMYDLSFSVKTSQADFETKYREIYKIGEGGFGAVMAGYRMKDLKSVAIKHIPNEKVHYREVVQNGKVHEVLDEVALMVKLAGGAESPGASAAVSLIDCYDLEDDLILVMERPIPSKDLYNYRRTKGGHLQEEEAKNILTQMVDASIDMHTKGVFHRDIKLENILVETGCKVPRVRIIDFGCGCFVKKGHYYDFAGTFSKAPPEWFMVGKYRAGPTTVWQLGTLLWDLLRQTPEFDTKKMLHQEMEINLNLSTNCKDFLQLCLVRDPERRATLEQLQLHPWIFNSKKD
ncbi:serine/threonine-protein kinase pim-2-like [Cebidichthys violaceus]|uniref:serine/threonine-protein kinase pim-2-like n=1 Tax=Cebidichthys violaceus TaxID=271503 RepID=UPI0035CB1FEF